MDGGLEGSKILGGFNPPNPPGKSDHDEWHRTQSPIDYDISD